MEEEGVTAGNDKLGCTSAGTESDSKEKSLLSQLRHAREVCHKGVVSKFNTKKSFSGNVLEIAEKIQHQIQSELSSRLQESSEELFKEANVFSALSKLEEMKIQEHDHNKQAWRFCGIPEEDAKRLLAVEQCRSLKSKKELSDKVHVCIEDLKDILKHKQEELQKLEQEIQEELTSISSKPVQLNY
ncbi:epidermal growth factor receptor substrate 15 homolog [Dysidea avara]|uniref:epidermal growth factor receptor substrate 15 homolog n=1 Tax=Dysidea avara TaxID=196820 RepID=UPI0033174860